MPFTKGQTEDIQSILNDHIKQLFENDEFVNGITKSLSEVLLKKLTEEMDAIKANVSVVKETNERLVRENNLLKREFEKQKLNLDQQEQYSRRNCIRIFGIIEEESENTDEKVLIVFNNKMNLNISKVDLDRTHRVGAVKSDKSVSKSNAKHRPIIVKFVSYQKRNLVFTNKKSLKATGISIREDLTKYRLSLLQDAIKKFGVANVWSSDGRILINKNNRRSIITTQDELDKIST